MSDDVKNKKTRKKSVFDAVSVAMMAAIIVVCSWITIPVGEIPITLQTFAIYMTVCLFGMKKSALSVLIYILLAAVGVPVLSGFRGGVGALLGVTGGYVVGFLFTAIVSGFIIDKFGKKVYVLYPALLLGMVITYAFGTAWFMFVYMKNTGEIGLMSVLGMCVLPYILPDIVKMSLAVGVSKAVESRFLRKMSAA